MRRGLAVSIVLSVSLLNPAAVFSQEPVDRAVIAKIRDEGLNRSQAPETFAYLTEVIGPRFTGSPAYKTAAEWARDKLKEWGLENPHLVMGQPIQTSFEREDRPQPTLASGPVAIGQPRPAGGNPAQTNQQNVTRIIREAGAGVVLRPNRGEHGTLFVLGRDSGEGAVPSVVLSAEHYNMIAWLEPFRDLGARRNISRFRPVRDKSARLLRLRFLDHFQNQSDGRLRSVAYSHSLLDGLHAWNSRTGSRAETRACRQLVLAGNQPLDHKAPTLIGLCKEMAGSVFVAETTCLNLQSHALRQVRPGHCHLPANDSGRVRQDNAHAGHVIARRNVDPFAKVHAVAFDSQQPES